MSSRHVRQILIDRGLLPSDDEREKNLDNLAKEIQRQMHRRTVKEAEKRRDDLMATHKRLKKLRHEALNKAIDKISLKELARSMAEKTELLTDEHIDNFVKQIGTKNYLRDAAAKLRININSGGKTIGSQDMGKMLEGETERAIRESLESYLVFHAGESDKKEDSGSGSLSAEELEESSWSDSDSDSGSGSPTPNKKRTYLILVICSCLALAGGIAMITTNVLRQKKKREQSENPSAIPQLSTTGFVGIGVSILGIVLLIVFSKMYASVRTDVSFAFL